MKKVQYNIVTTMRSLKHKDGSKGTHVYAIAAGDGAAGDKVVPRKPDHRKPKSTRSKSKSKPNKQNPSPNPIAVDESLLPFGLPVADLVEPQIDPHLRPVDFVQTLADLRRGIENCPLTDKSDEYLNQSVAFRSLPDPKMFRRSLRLARQHAVDVHTKLVLAAWLRFERREEDELSGSDPGQPTGCSGRNLDCPKASLISGYDPESISEPCPCVKQELEVDLEEDENDVSDLEEDENDMSFCIGDAEIRCKRTKIASLSIPFKELLYGGFRESKRDKINFTQNQISPEGMRIVESFSKTNKLPHLDPTVALEVLSLANHFCCEELKSACDARLSHEVRDVDNALLLIEYGLEETAHLLVAACLQIFLRNLPRTLRNGNIMKLFTSTEARERLSRSGHGSFVLYHFLSQVAMEDDMRSNRTTMLLEQAAECATRAWEKQVAFHQLGIVMLERNEYKDAKRWFEAASEVGHVYSIVGVARANYKRHHKYEAYKKLNSLAFRYEPSGWVYQERSLYCDGEEKVMDLERATELDPTLVYPYKYRTINLMNEKQTGAAFTEISKIIGFKVSADSLELRAWILIVLKDYEGALRDVRAVLTLEPSYRMFHGKMAGDRLVELLRQHVDQSSQADCWMQLYDRWSCVDDIGSLAVLHRMLENEPENSLVRFRLSLLLMRLNCQKAAMRSLRLARHHSSTEHERLVYEGWILHSTGHREEALHKAEESIAKQRSFEAFFLKAYVLGDTCVNADSSNNVVHLLEEALKCPSDGLRKGQALNNLGGVYVDCDNLDMAVRCYTNALDIKHTRAHQGLARVYHLQNRDKLAYDEMTKLIEKCRSNASAYEKRSEYCDRNMAKNDLRMVTELDPLRTYPYRFRAAVLMDAQKGAEAITELTKAITFKPDLQLLHLRATFHDMLGDHASALRDSQAALCFDPNHTQALKLYNKTRERVAQQDK